MKGNVKKILLFSSLLLVVMAGCSGTNGKNGVNGTNGKNGLNGTNGLNSPFLSFTSNNGQQVLLTWAQMYGTTGYKIYSSTVSGGPFSALGTTTTTRYLVNNLTPGTTYYFVVTAILSSGESPYSNVVSFRPYAMNTYPGNNSPCSIAVDASGNIWVTNDHNPGSVTELVPTSTPGIYQTNTTYNVGTYPEGIAIDASGNIWVANSGNSTVSELSPASTPGIYQTNTTYNVGTHPEGIAIDASGNIWVANSGNNTVSELSPTSTPGIYQTNTTYNVGYYPYGIAIDKSGDVLVANECADGSCNTGSVTQLSPTSTPGIFQTNTTYIISGEYSYGIAIDKSGNVLVVNECVDSSCNNGSVTQLSPDGTGGYYTYTTYTDGIGYEPEGGIAIDNSGNVWITNYCADSNCSNASVTELSPLDSTDYYYNTTYAFPGYGYGIAIDASGNLWLTDDSSTITEFYGITTGPQFWPYAGPVFPGNGMW